MRPKIKKLKDARQAILEAHGVSEDSEILTSPLCDHVRETLDGILFYIDEQIERCENPSHSDRKDVAYG